ncbi:GyrI-like domain-containing protein [Polynucleobacter sp.]|uniref:GyrI-like domain-containing protein n=1 Tax=Polynucleobacter sp. TaxID=2029855 RepID=UPI0030163140
MAKIDYKKDFPEMFKAPTDKPVEVKIPKMNYVMVTGKGSPDSKDFQHAVEALYGVTFTIKFMPKKGVEIAGYQEYSVPPLSGLWWMGDNTSFDIEKRDEWEWTAMIMQPHFVTEKLVDQAKEMLKKKKDNPMTDKVEFKPFEEGNTVQMMHVGPYSNEGETIQKIFDYIHENGYKLSGKHHEIYLGDPRRSAPEKLKTIIRHPFTK